MPEDYKSKPFKENIIPIEDATEVNPRVQGEIVFYQPKAGIYSPSWVWTEDWLSEDDKTHFQKIYTKKL